MKKIFLAVLLTGFVNLSVLAVCPITGDITGGACSINPSYTQNNSAQELLNNIQTNRNSSYNKQYIKNFYSPEWNTFQPNEGNNSNCRFGVCQNEAGNK